MAFNEGQAIESSGGTEINATPQKSELSPKNPELVMEESGRDNLESSSETILSPQEEITGVIGKINTFEGELLKVQDSAAGDREEMNRLLEEMDLPPKKENLPAEVDAANKLKEAEVQLDALREEGKEWIEKNGKENLPAGLAIELEDGVLEARGDFEEENIDNQEPGKDTEQNKENKKEEKEEKEEKDQQKEREEEAKRAKERLIGDFEKAMRGDPITSSATNVELAIGVMKSLVPEAVDKVADDYVHGRTNKHPIQKSAYIKWEVPSFSDRISGDNNIKKLVIIFDNISIKSADEGELLKKEDNEKQDRKNTGGNEVKEGRAGE